MSSAVCVMSSAVCNSVWRSGAADSQRKPDLHPPVRLQPRPFRQVSLGSDPALWFCSGLNLDFLFQGLQGGGWGRSCAGGQRSGGGACVEDAPQSGLGLLRRVDRKSGAAA